MKRHWYALQDRERLVLSIGAVFCLLVICYALFYAPLARHVDSALHELAEKKAILNWIRKVKTVDLPSHQAIALNANQRLTVIAEKLNQTPLRKFPYQLEQTTSGDIQLSFETVPYNTLVTWLWHFSQVYTIHIKQFEVDSTKTPGVVKSRIILGD